MLFGSIYIYSKSINVFIGIIYSKFQIVMIFGFEEMKKGMGLVFQLFICNFIILKKIDLFKVNKYK